MRNNNHATLTPDASGNLQFSFSYNAGLITALKLEIPYTDRTWQPDKKLWIVDCRHADKLVDLVAQYMGLSISKPTLSNKTSKLETRTIRLEYLGACKDRGNGEITATGYVDNGWNVIFPLQVLKAWFDPDGKERPSEATTLYSILGLSSKTTQEEIKKAYRRLARQWHPDVCKEPDATEQFKKLQNAYEILSDDNKRKRYNAGLQLEASLTTKGIPFLKGHYSNNSLADMLRSQEVIYRSPLRCGWVLAEGEQVLNRFVVKTILGWEDITNSQNQTMVSSWQSGDDFFTIQWS